MLSRSRVRTKLLAIAVPGVLCAAALGWIDISHRLDERARAEHMLAVSHSLRMADAFAEQVQRERTLQVGLRLRDETTSGALTAQIGASDEAGRHLHESLDALLGVPTPPDAEQLSGDIVSAMAHAITGLAPLRSQPGRSAREQLDAYTALLTPLLSSARALAYLDPDMSRDTTALHWLSEATEADSTRGADALVAATEGGGSLFGGGDAELVATLRTKLESFAGSATEATAKRVADLVAQPLFVAQPGTTGDQLPSFETIQGAGLARTAQLHEAARAILDAQERTSDAVVARSRRAVLEVLVLVGAALGVVVALALGTAAGMSRTLRKLARAAKEISEHQLPAMVASLRTGTPSTLAFPKVDTSRRDEFGQVATALDGLGRMASVVTAQQSSAVRKGIGEIYVHLARRNQHLLDRQIEFIDRLEANEEDPDQLEQLFQLDHLATRMRRNAESLLVLAGAEAPRDRHRRIAVTDVLRVAMGEVEDFDRVLLASVDEVTVQGGAAADLAHLLAELMENGTQFSAPDRAVEVSGRLDDDGRYRIRVLDQGIGMSAAKVTEVNDLLADPPVLGLAMSRSLGFVVVATLAARHGIEVRVSSAHRTGSGLVGTTVTVVVPAGLVVASGADARVRRGWNAEGEYVDETIEAPRTERPVQPVAPVVAPVAEPSEEPVVATVPEPAPVDASWWFPATVPDAPVPAKLEERLPEGEAFESGIYGLLGREAPAAEHATPPAPTDLPRRRPGSTLEGAGAAASATPAVAAPGRTPDEIRTMLDRYRGAFAAGRDSSAANSDSVDREDGQAIDPQDPGHG